MRHRVTFTSAAVACLVACLATVSRAAPTELPRGPWKTVTVAVMPVVWLGGLADPFVDGPDGARLRGEAARWHRGIEQAFAERDQVAVLGSAELHERLAREPDVRRAASLAQARFAAGLEHWRALRAKDALVELDRARELYLEAFADLADPKALADVELHRGLALIDLDEVGPARVAFAQMFALDPTRRFERGYYGAAIEQELAGAANDVAAVPAPFAILWPAERLAALGKRLAVDVWALGTLAGPRPRVELALFDNRLAAVSLRELFEIVPDTMVEDLDRVVSAWHTCALEAPRAFVRPAWRPRWYVDFGYAHAVWLQHRRTRDYLHGPGAHVGVTFVPTPGLELWAKTTARVTLSDANNDLLDVFTTTHIALGAGLGIGDSGLSFTLRAGVDVAFSLSDIDMTTDVDCKFFGAGERCRSIFRADSPAVWLGLDVSAALRVAPSRSWYFAFTAGTAIYAFSASVVSELNFPLYGTFGFGLPF